jgi:hypothetical protein
MAVTRAAAPTRVIKVEARGAVLKEAVEAIKATRVTAAPIKVMVAAEVVAEVVEAALKAAAAVVAVERPQMRHPPTLRPRTLRRLTGPRPRRRSPSISGRPPHLPQRR